MCLRQSKTRHSTVETMSTEKNRLHQPLKPYQTIVSNVDAVDEVIISYSLIVTRLPYMTCIFLILCFCTLGINQRYRTIKSVNQMAPCR